MTSLMTPVLWRVAEGVMLLTIRARETYVFCSCLVLSQKLRAMGSLLKVNAQALIIFKIRNRLELDAIIEELSAIYDKKVLMEMYQIATDQPYSFWYCNLAASKVEDMFWLRFEQRMIPSAPTTPSSNAIAV